MLLLCCYPPEHTSMTLILNTNHRTVSPSQIFIQTFLGGDKLHYGPLRQRILIHEVDVADVDQDRSQLS